MRDAMEARFWADHGSDYANDIARLLKGVRAVLRDAWIGFERLNEIEFDAPWRRQEEAQAPLRPSVGKGFNFKPVALALAFGLTTVVFSVSASLPNVGRAEASILSSGDGAPTPYLA